MYKQDVALMFKNLSSIVVVTTLEKINNVDMFEILSKHNLNILKYICISYWRWAVFIYVHLPYVWNIRKTLHSAFGHRLIK